MQLAYPQNDTRAETLRYLGAGGWQPDAASQVLLQKAEDALRAALPAPKLPLAAAFADAQMELTCLTERRAFVTGVRLGVRLLRAMEEDPFAIA